MLPEPGDTDDELVPVHLLNAPPRLWARASAHSSDLMREFALLSFAPASAAAPVPGRFFEVLQQLQQRYAGVSNQRAIDLEASIHAGELSRDWRYDVPRRAGADVAQLTELLDEADAFCEAGAGVMTLPAPHDQRVFRQWFGRQFWDQIEEGAAPVPWDGPLD